MYLKYDKKLILNLKNLTITDKLTKIKQIIDTNLSFDKIDENYLITISDLNYKSLGLKLSGDINLNNNQIDNLINNPIKTLELNNLIFNYDTNLSDIKSDIVYLNYRNDNLSLKFKNPSMAGIKIDGTTVLLENLTTSLILKLDLYSKNLLDPNLLNIVKYYGVEIPIVQYNGINNINFKLNLPFDNNPLDIYLNANIKNTLVQYDDINFSSELLDIEYKNNELTIISPAVNFILLEQEFLLNNMEMSLKDNPIKLNTILHDENNNNYNLFSNVDLDKQNVLGDIEILNYRYEDTIKIKKQNLNFKLNFKSDIIVDLISKDKSKFKINIKDKNISLDKLKVNIKNNCISTTSNAMDENNNSYKLISNINLNKSLIIGDVYINNFIYDNFLKIEKQNISYTVDYKVDSKVNLKSNSKIKIADNNISLHNLNIFYTNNKLKVNVGIEDENNNSIVLSNNTNLDKNISFGKLDINQLTYDKYLLVKNKNISYDLNFTSGLDLNIPDLGLKYTNKSNTKHILSIDKFNKILENINFINLKKSKVSSKLVAFSDTEFKKTYIAINDLNIDINSTKMKSDKEDDNSSTLYPNIDLKLFNSKIQYDNNKIQTDFIQVKGKNKKLKITIKPSNEKFNIQIDIEDKKINILAKNMSDKFINALAKKNLFKDGTLDFTAKGTFDSIEAEINFHKTTLQNVRVLNNLISFINTTPAIINPILALPTLFRMGETNFDLKGYYIKSGNINFIYDIKYNYLDIFDIYTKSKMTDFKGTALIDIKEKLIDINVDVIFLKDYSKFINHIPILGYIITGDDGNFVTTVDIKGTFEEQSFETYAIKNAAKGTFNVIKRTLSVPFLPFIDNKKDNKEKE